MLHWIVAVSDHCLLILLQNDSYCSSYNDSHSPREMHHRQCFISILQLESLIIKAENHVTCFDYFIPVLGQNGQEIVHYFLNIPFISIRQSADTLFYSQLRLFKCFMLRAVFSHATSSNARDCVEKYTVYENISYIIAYCKSDEVTALYPMKIHQVSRNSDQFTKPFCPKIGTKYHVNNGNSCFSVNV